MIQKTNRDHSFDIELATIVGVEKAIILKNVDHWCRENARKTASEYFFDGQYWTAESLKSLAKKYPYMKRSSIARWVNELEKNGWLVIGKKEREVNFYRPGLVFELWNAGEDWETELDRLSQNETDKSCLKMGQGLSQNGTGAVSKWDRGCLKMGHFNIEGNVDPDFDMNIENGAEILNGQNGMFVEKPKSDNGKTRAKKSVEYQPRDVAGFLEIPQQVFYREVLANGSWADYLNYRRTKDRFRYKDAKSHALAIKNVFTITGGKPDQVQAVVDQSRAKGWTGLFPIKNDNDGRNGTAKHYNTNPGNGGDFFGGGDSPFFAGIK